MTLAGQVALVTGSARGLGRAIALALAARGATVAVHYRRSAAEADAVAAEAGGAAFQADVTDPAACEALVAAVVARYGALNVLVNNVGDFHGGSVLAHGVADWKAMLDSNLLSVVGMCQAALPAPGLARVVNVGFAGCGQVAARPAYTAYAVAKTGALVYTKSLAAVAAPITVNMVSPGTLEGSVAYPPRAAVPMGRWGHPDEVVAAILYLLGPEAAYVTGQHLEVAGGWAL